MRAETVGGVEREEDEVKRLKEQMQKRRRMAGDSVVKRP